MKFYAAESAEGNILGIGTTQEAARRHARANLKAAGSRMRWAQIVEISEAKFLLYSMHGIFVADEKAAASN